MKNKTWFHYFFFSVAIIVMVYAGDQIAIKSIGTSSWIFRCSVATSALAISMFGISLSIGIKWEKDIEESEKKNKYIDSLLNKKRHTQKTAGEIKDHSTELGDMICRCNIKSDFAEIFDIISLYLIIISVLLYGTGVFLI